MQVEASARRAAPGRQSSSLYLMTWVAVGAFGLGYIGVATTRPDLLGTILPLAEQPQDQANAGRQSGDLTEEMVVLRKWIHDLQHELAATKSSLHEQAVHTSAVLQRIAAAEERFGTLRDVREPTGKVPAPKVQTRAQAPAQVPAQAPVQAQVQASAPTAEAGPRPAQTQAQIQAQPQAWAPEVAGASIPNVRIMNTATAPITTGSVPDATTPGAPTAKSTAVQVAPRAIEIGTAESLDGLRAKWGEIASRNSDVLADAAPRYRLSADGRAAPFTLLAGPFETPADATRACNALRTKGVACRVGGAYTGNTF